MLTMLWMLVITSGLVAYIYVGYPLLIWLLGTLRARKIERAPYSGGISVLIAAHNEAGTLRQKVTSLVELAAHELIREIWLGLDGCTDDTATAVRSLGIVSDGNSDTLSEGLHGEIKRPVVRLLEFAERRGKAAVLNDLMARAGQPVVVMMDARQRIPAGALSTLLEPFADPQVGVVSGALVYETAEGGAPKGADSYWSYEKQIRLSESRFWAVPGATGALYAIRRELLAPIPAETLVDDVLIPMQAVLRGYRCLFEPKAQVFDRPTSHFGQENLRKRRTLAGIWQTMRLMPKIYSPAANPIWWQWISHKFLRLLTPFLVILALFSLVGLAEEGFLWAKWLLGGALGAMLASAGAYWGAKWFNSRILGLMGAFFGVNLALLQAAGDALTGRFEARWSK